MLFKTRSAAVYGIEAYLVDVEVNLTSGGNGQVIIVGLPDTAVRESRNRVLPAIRNNGYGAPYQRIVINLEPADVKKEGSAFDLPMAIGILGGYGLLAKQDICDYLMVGELSLDGKLRPVKGVLSIAMLARDRKIPHLLVPLGNAPVVEGVAVYPVRTLTEVVEFINGTRIIDPVRAEQSSRCARTASPHGRLPGCARTISHQTRDRSCDGRRTQHADVVAGMQRPYRFSISSSLDSDPETIEFSLAIDDG
jgi:magnesium chelatase family protein